MSDNSITIASKQSNCPYNKQKAEDILNWLVSINVVSKSLSDCCLDSEGGHAISEAAKEVTNYPEHLPFDLNINGLSVITKRQVFDTGGNGIEKIICPNCQMDISHEEWSFDDWYIEKSNNMTCPVCHTDSEINGFKFTPEWGFSDLGFTFWNWPAFKDEFIQEFKQRIDTDIVIVYQHI